jgi:hypothetical protein
LKRCETMTADGPPNMAALVVLAAPRGPALHKRPPAPCASAALLSQCCVLSAAATHQHCAPGVIACAWLQQLDTSAMHQFDG